MKYFHRDFKTYQPLRKYFTITYSAIQNAYSEISKGHKIYDLLFNGNIRKQLFGGAMYKYRNLLKEFIDETGANCSISSSKLWENIRTKPEKLIGKSIFLNLYSNLGHEGNRACTVVSKKLIDSGYKVNVLNGLEWNEKVTDFENRTHQVSNYINCDILIFYSTNSIVAKDWWQDSFKSLLTACSLKNIPVIMSSNSKSKLKDFDIVNVEFLDNRKNMNQVLNEVFGE